MTTLKFTRTFDDDSWSNHYTSGDYKLYQERVFRNNGASRCDGSWIVEIKGKIEASYNTLKEAKNHCNIMEMFK